MRGSVVLLLPAVVLASQVTPVTQTNVATPSIETLDSIQPATTAAFSIQTAGPEYTASFPTHVSEEELRKRQNAGQVNGAAAAATVVTQQSPVTTYMIYGDGGKEIPVAYTQIFSAVPDQWTGPSSGSIGLGSISGQVGVVKTKVKRNLVAAATDAIKNVGLEKRAMKSRSTSAGVSNTPKIRATVLACTVVAVLPFLFFMA